MKLPNTPEGQAILLHPWPQKTHGDVTGYTRVTWERLTWKLNMDHHIPLQPSGFQVPCVQHLLKSVLPTLPHPIQTLIGCQVKSNQPPRAKLDREQHEQHWFCQAKPWLQDLPNDPCSGPYVTLQEFFRRRLTHPDSLPQIHPSLPRCSVLQSIYITVSPLINVLDSVYLDGEAPSESVGCS